MVIAGTLQPTDWAWYEGLAQWIPLHQVPGFTAASTPQALPPARRPVMVWVISLFFFICTPLSLLSLLLLPLMSSGVIPVQEHQRHFFASLNAFDYVLSLANIILSLTWAIQLFRLKRSALPIFLGLFVFGVLVLLYNILLKDWLNAVGTVGLIGAGFAWLFNFALLWYTWRLSRKGVLR